MKHVAWQMSLQAMEDHRKCQGGAGCRFTQGEGAGKPHGEVRDEQGLGGDDGGRL